MQRRTLLIAFFSLAGAASFPTHGQSLPPSDYTEVSGIKFDNQIVANGTKLLLNGAGTRYKFVIKVYAAALYAPSRISKPEAAWDTTGPRAIKVVMLRDVDANELGKLFTRGMEDNVTREEFGKAIAGTLKLANIWGERKKLVAGDNFVVSYKPGFGTTFLVNGRDEGQVVKEPEFFSALMKIWLGNAPADYLLKDALLGIQRRATQ